LKKRFYLTYPPELITEPFIYEAGKRYKVVTNVRQASASNKLGLVALELEGEESEIEKAVKFFIDKGIKVEPIELDIVE